MSWHGFVDCLARAMTAEGGSDGRVFRDYGIGKAVVYTALVWNVARDVPTGQHGQLLAYKAHAG